MSAYNTDDTTPIQQITLGGIDITMEDIVKFAPVVTLHRDDLYQPVSIDFLASNCSVCNSNGSVSILNPTLMDLAQVTDSTKYLNISPNASPGMPTGTGKMVVAPMYVCPQVPEGGDFVDLSFIMLYAFNGSQCVRVFPPSSSAYDVTVPNYAEHQGDIEVVTVRVDKTLSKILHVRMEAHGDSSYETMETSVETIQYAHKHPVVRSSLNSHGNYNGYGMSFPGCITLEDYSPSFGPFGDVGADIIDIVDPFSLTDGSNEGSVWRPFALDDNNNETPNGQLLMIGFADGMPIDPCQNWSLFPGRYGALQKNTSTSCAQIPSEPITSAQEGFANSIVITTSFLDFLPDDVTDGNGPSGLVGRETTNVDEPRLPPLTHGLIWSPDHNVITPEGNICMLRGSPAAVVTNDYLMVMYQSDATPGQLMRILLENGQWTSESPLRGPGGDSTYGTSYGPGLIVYRDVLYVIHQGANDSRTLMYGTSIDHGMNFSDDQPLLSTSGNSYPVATYPALCVYGDALWIIRCDPDSPALLCATFDGTTWSDDFQLGGLVCYNYHPPACVVYQEKMWCFYEGDEGTLMYAVFDGSFWSKPIPVPNQGFGTAGVSATVFDDKIFILREIAGNDGKIVGGVYDDGVWLQDVYIPDADNPHGTSGAPYLVEYHDVLFTLHAGQRDTHELWCATAIREF